MNMLRFDTAEINDFLKPQTACVDNIGYNTGKNPKQLRGHVSACLRVTLSFRIACNTSSQKEKEKQVKSGKAASRSPNERVMPVAMRCQ